MSGAYGSEQGGLPSWEDKMEHALELVVEPGVFAVCKTAEGNLSALGVEGAGIILLPLMQQQAAALLAAGQAAPFQWGP
jgi:hypothetical protein